MKWLGGRESGNVEDRRGMSAGGVAIGGGVIGIIIYLINVFMGGDASQIPQLPQQSPQQEQQMTAEEKAADDERASFVKVTLGYTEDVWKDLFENACFKIIDFCRKQQPPNWIAPKMVHKSTFGYALPTKD